MKILLTGGAGFIGHHVTSQLISQGHDCCVVDSLTDYGFVNSDEMTYLNQERFKKFSGLFFNYDIRQADRIDGVFATFQPDVVVHLASFPRQKIVSASPAWASEVMCTGLINLLESSKKHRIQKFVYISSSMVYGDFSDDVTEDFACKPQGQYGIMKLMGEHLVQDYTRRGCFDHVIVRPSAVYGELDVEDRVISKFMLAAMRGQVLKVNGANETLDFTYVEDAASGIASAAVSEQARNKIYNITKSHSTSLLQAAELAVKIAGKGSIEVRDKDADFPSRGALNIDAARRDFGFDPQVDVEEGFRRYHAWFVNSDFWASRIRNDNRTK
jgi:nucleoside-diphosphate-sugar epimerase